ncbi:MULTISPECIES: alpha/beta hydrolase [Arthrobacter]|uniref:alpha/beta hydrolase n=1 Tax=Arthrobacter TaxID=1663 RepID=UPI002102CDA9|nr:MULTISPECIES: phospholipase [Arthrobacter]MCQ1951717.1 phospholipase [Arthrobacter sp. zg-Y238]MCQ1956145.1 phospholipase [Arthrobacter jinronghuae]
MENVTWSEPAERRRGRELVVFLHGYGSGEQAMERLFIALPASAVGAAVRGPLDVGGASGWFLLDPLLNSDTTEVLESALSLLAWLDRTRTEYGFTGMSLVGFSQGMAMAGTLLRLRPKDFRAVVGLSGFIARNELLAAAEPLPVRVPFFWGRDRQDWVINADAVDYTAQWLDENAALTARTYSGMGHSIGTSEITDVAVFLRRYLASDTP